MSQKSIEEDSVSSKSHSLNKIRDYIKKSFTQFPRGPRSISSIGSQLENAADAVQPPPTFSAVDVLDQDLHNLEQQLTLLTDAIHEVKEETQKQLDTIVGTMKREIERLGKLGERLDVFEEHVQIERENINEQLEEMEAKIHHQINNQYNDLQEAVERLYIRMDSLERKYQDQKEQEDTEIKESSYIRSLTVKGVNFILTIAQVVLVIVNTIVETIRPLSSNIANMCFLCLVLFAIAFFRDDEVRTVTKRSLKKTFPFLKVFFELLGWDGR